MSVSGWLNASDYEGVRALGFDKVINFRPDNEARGQIASVEAQTAAEASGLQYVHVPVTKNDLFTDDVVAKAVRELGGAGRVLGYCASGQRAAIVWAAATARSAPVDEVLSLLHDAGFDLGFIRDDLDAQADRARWSNDAGVPKTDAAEDGKTSLEVAA